MTPGRHDDSGCASRPFYPEARDHGPFSTEAEVRALPAVQAVYAAFDRDPGLGKMAGPSQRMLLDALAEGGVYLGDYDLRITEWLSGWEPSTVAVIAGWVTRASGAVPGESRQGLWPTPRSGQFPPRGKVGEHREGSPS